MFAKYFPKELYVFDIIIKREHRHRVQKPVHARAISQGDLHKLEGTMKGEFIRETTFHSKFH